MPENDLTTRFEEASREAKQLPARPSNDDLLALYGYYKQATEGDVQGERPGMTDFAARAKYDTWAELKGTAQEDAMRTYIDHVERLKAGA